MAGPRCALCPVKLTYLAFVFTVWSIVIQLQGFGVCEYTNKQDAQDAIEQLDNTTLQGNMHLS